MAAAPILASNISDVSFRSVPEDMWLTDAAISAKGIGPGEEVFMIGRFIDADGGVVNSPAARFGHISLMPVPVVRKTGERTQSYCLDMHSRTGYSGSPVFVFRKPGQDLSHGNLDMSDQFLFLLGIHWGQFPEAWEIKSKTAAQKQAVQKQTQLSLNENETYVEGLSGMTCVAPAQAIKRLLDTPKLLAFRDEADRNWSKVLGESKAIAALSDSRPDFTAASYRVFPSLPPLKPDPEAH